MAKGWYAVHTYSGWEQRIESQARQMMQDDDKLGKYCTDVRVPIRVIKEMKDGKEKERKSKILPSYILMELDMPSDIEEEKRLIFMVKSIEGVTGFVNATTARGSRPIPLTPSEVRNIFELTGDIKSTRTAVSFVSFEKGDKISIKAGSFQGFTGTIEEVQKERGRLKVAVEIFGRPTIVDIETSDAEKI